MSPLSSPWSNPVGAGGGLWGLGGAGGRGGGCAFLTSLGGAGVV